MFDANIFSKRVVEAVQKPTAKISILRLKEKYYFAGSEYIVQLRILEDFAHWNLAFEIADETSFDKVEMYLYVLFNDKYIDISLIEEAKLLSSMTNNISRSGDFYNELLWRQEAVKSHNFWEDYRMRCMNIFYKLEGIDV